MSDNAGREENQEFFEFMLSPKDNADGTPVTGDEEARRQQAVVLHLQNIAKKHGIEIAPTSVQPMEQQVPNTQGQNIKQIAASLLPQADERVRTSYERASVELPDGTTIKRARILLGCFDSLADSVQKFVEQSWRERVFGSTPIAMFVKAGKWVYMKVKVGKDEPAGTATAAAEEQDDPASGTPTGGVR